MKLSPILDSIAAQFAGRVKVGKVNIHENMDLAQEYQVYSIPRVLLFNRNSKPSQQLTGLVSQQQLSKLISSVVTTTA